MKALLICVVLIIVYGQAAIKDFETSKSLYFQEKYFRFLANNYDQIEQGNFWTTFGQEKGIGFKALDNFGSFVLVKDWSMYSFKLTKIMFRPFCSYKLEGKLYDAEMLLIHTLDNGYYPPGKRMNLGVNYLVISVPFKKTSDKNPANDKIFEFLRLSEYHSFVSSLNNGKQPTRISPLKPIKLHHIIQHQPSYLVQSKLPYNQQDALYLIFTQYHYISESDLYLLQTTYFTLFTDMTSDTEKNNYLLDSTIVDYYRNWDNKNEVKPKATLMAYNSQLFIKISGLFLFISIALLL